MLHHITPDGHIHWKCHRKDCPPLTAHISHEEIRYSDPNHVILPKCPNCGSQTGINVDWPPEDLLPPIIYRDSRGKIVDVKKQGAENFTKVLDHYERDAAGKQVRVIDGVEWNPAIARHQEFKRQLEAIGKKPAEN